MTETPLRSAIARLATDDEFARAVRELPERVAADHGLSDDDMTTLAALVVDDRRHVPQRLEERLSRSALFFGGELHAGDSGDSGSSDSGSSDSGSSDSGSSDSGESGESGDSGDSGSDAENSSSSDSTSDADSGDSDSGDSDSGDSDSGDSGSSDSTSESASERSSEPSDADDPDSESDEDAGGGSTSDASTSTDDDDADTTTSSTDSTGREDGDPGPSASTSSNGSAPATSADAGGQAPPTTTTGAEHASAMGPTTSVPTATGPEYETATIVPEQGVSGEATSDTDRPADPARPGVVADPVEVEPGGTDRSTDFGHGLAPVVTPAGVVPDGHGSHTGGSGVAYPRPYLSPLPDAHPVTPSVDANGVEHSLVFMPDGTQQERAVHPDGTGTRTDYWRDPYEGTETVLARWTMERQPDGSWVETQVVEPGVPPDVVTHHTDGHSELVHRQQNASGFPQTVRTATYPDGRTVTTTTDVTSVNQVATSMQQVVVERVLHDDHGWSETRTTTLASDHRLHSGIVTEHRGPDGTSTGRTFTFVDGTTMSFDAQGRLVGGSAPGPGGPGLNQMGGLTTAHHDPDGMYLGRTVTFPNGATEYYDARGALVGGSSPLPGGGESAWASSSTKVEFNQANQGGAVDETTHYDQYGTITGYTMTGTDGSVRHYDAAWNLVSGSAPLPGGGESAWATSSVPESSPQADRNIAFGDAEGGPGIPSDQDALVVPASDPAGGPVDVVDRALADYPGRVVGHEVVSESVRGTTVLVHHEDGSTTQVLRQFDHSHGITYDIRTEPDGTTVRQSWLPTGPNGEMEPNQTVTTRPDGSVSTLYLGQREDIFYPFTEVTTYPDGSRTVFSSYGDPSTPNDREPGATMEYRRVDTDPAGRTTITTWGSGSAGAASVTVEHPDGTRTVDSIPGVIHGTQSEVVVLRHPDGSTETVVWGQNGYDTYGTPRMAHWSTPATAGGDTGTGEEAGETGTGAEAGLVAGPVMATAPVAAATTPAPAGDPNAGYHGGVVRSAPTTQPDGSQVVHVRYGDGTTVEVSRTTDPGTGVRTDTWTETDGTTVERTRAVDGTEVTVRTSPDGTVTASSVGEHFAAESTRPDGTWSQAEWSPSSGAPDRVFLTVDHLAGGVRVDTVVSTTAGGGHVATITASDGSVETVRITAHDVENPDGSTTRVFTFPDGETDAFTIAPDGRVVHHEGHHGDGSSESWAPERAAPPAPVPVTTTDPVTGIAVSITEAPDGHRTTVTVTPDGARTERIVAPDGSWTETFDDGRGTTTDAYGTAGSLTQVRTEHADGSWTLREPREDGSSTEMAGRADGWFTQTNREADGSWFTVIVEPDGTRTETSGDAGEDPGSVGTTTYAEDGSSVTRDPDGTVTTMRDLPGGGLQHVVTAPDGTTTTTDFGPDGFGTRETVIGPDGTGTRRIANSDGTVTTVDVHTDAYGDVVEQPRPSNAGNASNAGSAGHGTEMPAPPVDRPVEENVTLHYGNLQIFRFHDGHIEIFASWQHSDEIVEMSFPPDADWRNTVIHESTPVSIADGVGTYHYEKTLTYADGRMERVSYGGVEPVWNDWF